MLRANAHIGWIGFGRMGRPMCTNLLNAGFRVSVYNRDKAKRPAISELGATAVDSPAALAAACEIIVSTIWDDEALHDVVLGPAGVLSQPRNDFMFIDMSTVSVKGSAVVAAELSLRGIPYLRAPASGSGPVAEQGKLSIYVSGPAETHKHCMPLFNVLGSKQTYVGAAEEARVYKLAINILVQTSSAILGEALSFGERAGVDRGQLMDAINDSVVGSDHYKLRADTIKRRASASPVMTSNLKDLNLALSMAAERGCALPITALVQQYLAVIYGGGKPVNAIVALTAFLDRINEPASSA
jgi:3-hydroxyisobutyrate dehydrogenase